MHNLREVQDGAGPDYWLNLSWMSLSEFPELPHKLGQSRMLNLLLWMLQLISQSYVPYKHAPQLSHGCMHSEEACLVGCWLVNSTKDLIYQVFQYLYRYIATALFSDMVI